MHIENLKVAVSYLAAIPASKWNMDHFLSPLGNCCAMGHLAKARMFDLYLGCYAQDEHPVTMIGREPDIPLGMDVSTAIAVFDLSPSQVTNLFCTLTYEEWTLSQQDGWSHKQAWFHRLRKLLNETGTPFETVFGDGEFERFPCYEYLEK